MPIKNGRMILVGITNSPRGLGLKQITDEKRNSNDIDKIYQNHQVVFSLYYRWGNGDDK